MTDKITVIPSAKLQNIPEMLRGLADDIERGEYGDVSETVVVTAGDNFNVFAFGRADGTVAHYLLGCAMAKLQKKRIEG